MEIKEITTAEELRPLLSLRKERVDLKFSPAVKYLGAYMNGRLVGVVGYQRLGPHLVRYKSSGVLPEYRKMGIYSLLWRAREEMYNTGSDTITAFCTEKSLPMFLAHGFRKVSERNGITFVKRNG